MPRLILAIVLIGLALAAPAAVAAPQPEGDATVVTPNVYVRDQAEDPWGQDTNDQAMDQVFGTDPWEEEYFQTVDTGSGSGGLFGPGVRFIYLDGGDDGAEELEAFLAANEAALRAFVERGGALFLNSAPNEGDGMSYDGRQIVYDDTFSDFVVAADGSHPIFTGPSTPVGTTFEGDSFGHALIQGPGLTPLILRTVGDDEGEPGDPDAVVLAQYSGCGLTLIGGMTTTNFHDPQPNALNLRANIIHYAANTDVCAPTSSSAGCASSSEVGVTVADARSGPASVRYSTDGGAEQTAPTDAAGNARISVGQGSHTVAFRGVDNAGNTEANANSVTVTCAAALPSDRTRPRASVAGVSRRCASRSFRIRVTVRDGSGVARVTVHRGRRELADRSFRNTTRASFTVRISVAGLRAGRHTIRIGARDGAGNRRITRQSFRRCAVRRVSPVLTG